MQAGLRFPAYKHPVGTGLGIIVLAPLMWVACAGIGWAFNRFHVMLYLGMFSPVFVTVLGGTIAWMGELVAKRAGCRIRPLSVLVAVIGGLCALGAMWTDWVFLVATEVYEMDLQQLAYTEIAYDPKVALPIISTALENGWYAIFDFVPRGKVLVGLWVLEALAIVGPSLGVGRLPSYVWCDNCGQWATRSVRVAGLPQDDAQEDALERFDGGDFTAFAQLPDPPDNERTQPCIDLWSCDSCSRIIAARTGRRDIRRNEGQQWMCVETDSPPLAMDAAMSASMPPARQDPWSHLSGP